MASYRIKLNNGTTSLDLLSGDIKLREGGLSMPAPPVNPAYVSSPFFDGDKMSSHRYGNRIISLKLRATGSSLADLKTNLREIQRLLDDARTYQLNLAKQGTITASGKLYLELQWGDTAAQSTYFEVVRGEFVMPDDFYSVVLAISFNVLDCELKLECKPFGLYTAQDIAQDTLENCQDYPMQENLITGWNAIANIYGDNWQAQTFTTPVAGYTATGAMIQGQRSGTIGTVTMAIYATAAGLPTGNALATGTVDASALPTDSPYGWLMATFVMPVALAGSTLYALVVSLAGGDAGNKINAFYNNAGGEPNGERCTSADAGVNWAANAGHDLMFAVFGGAQRFNYKDIITSESHGDVPALLYGKLAITGTNADKKMWIAKRSGHRYNDDLWIDGHEFSTVTRTTTDPDVSLGGYTHAETAISESLFGQARMTVGVGATAEEIGYFTFALSSPPRGFFRVLIRARVDPNNADHYARMLFGLGYNYGGRTSAPVYASGDYQIPAANDTWEILDLGTVMIPPIAESDIAGNPTFNLRVYLYLTDANAFTGINDFEIDYIFLLPIDEGVIIIDDTDSADVLALDGITDSPAAYKLSGANVSEYLDYVGNVFTLGRETTRIYVLRDDPPAGTFAVDLKYLPRFLIL